MRLVIKLQEEQKETFSTLAVYDGQKKMYTVSELDLGETGSKVQSVFYPEAHVGYKSLISAMGSVLRKNGVRRPLDECRKPN
jgi:hypothetical protein